LAKGSFFFVVTLLFFVIARFSSQPPPLAPRRIALPMADPSARAIPAIPARRYGQPRGAGTSGLPQRKR